MFNRRGPMILAKGVIETLPFLLRGKLLPYNADARAHVCVCARAVGCICYAQTEVTHPEYVGFGGGQENYGQKSGSPAMHHRHPDVGQCLTPTKEKTRSETDCVQLFLVGSMSPLDHCVAHEVSVGVMK